MYLYHRAVRVSLGSPHMFNLFVAAVDLIDESTSIYIKRYISYLACP